MLLRDEPFANPSVLARRAQTFRGVPGMSASEVRHSCVVAQPWNHSV